MMNSKILNGKDYVILDNWLSNDDVINAQNMFYNKDFPWYLPSYDIKNKKFGTVWPEVREEMELFKDKGYVESWQLVHIFVKWNPIKQQGEDNNSPAPKFVDFMFSSLGKKFNIPNFKIYRVKANLKPQHLGANVNSFDAPHLDLNEKDCLTAIYYVNDSDGPTFIFDDNKNVKKIIEAKRGRLLVMNSHLLHSAGFPVKYQNRIVVNFNFEECYD